LYEVLDLAVHWLLTTHEVDTEQRKTIEEEWNGPLSDVTRDLPPEDAWAPSWWTGDEDAARSALVAAANLGRGR
jgi:hypothetical protein